VRRGGGRHRPGEGILGGDAEEKLNPTSAAAVVRTQQRADLNEIAQSQSPCPLGL